MHVTDAAFRARDNGVKRHIAVDVNGLLLAVVVTAASIQDRDAAHRLLAALRGSFSTIRLVWADGGYPGRLLIWAKDVLTLTMQIIKRPVHRVGDVEQHVRQRHRAKPRAGAAAVVPLPPAPQHRLSTDRKQCRHPGLVRRARYRPAAGNPGDRPRRRRPSRHRHRR